MIVGFVGLGSMGLGMARNLAQAAGRVGEDDSAVGALRGRLAALVAEVEAAGAARGVLGDYGGLRVRPSPPPVAGMGPRLPRLEAATVEVGRVVVWNRENGDRERRYREVEAAGGERAASLGVLAQACDAVCLCVNEAADVMECLRGLAEATPGTLVVDHTTISPREAESARALAAGLGLRYADAPVTGGHAGAENGTLTAFFGGPREDVEAAMGIAAAYATRREWIGERVGDGQRMKMANQIAVSAAILGFCEATAYAAKAGLSVSEAIRCVESGAGGSWVFTWFGPALVKALESGRWEAMFSVANHLKDCGLVVRSAEEADAAVPLTRLCESLLERFDETERREANIRLYELLLELGSALE